MTVSSNDIERDLQRLEAELRRLESEYNMFFAGRLTRPPWETRSRVETLVRQCDRASIQNYGDRFRFTTMQSRFAAFTALWDRGLRARDEGRPGPFAHPRTDKEPAQKVPDRILHIASFQDPVHEIDKLTALYESLSDARQELGEETVPFHKFAELVKNQVKKLQQGGSPDVAFRVAVKNGKVSLTARGLKGAGRQG